MKTRQIVWVVLLSVLLVLPLVVLLFQQQSKNVAVQNPEPVVEVDSGQAEKDPKPKDPPSDQPTDPPADKPADKPADPPADKPEQQEPPEYVWGVDTANFVDQAFFQCVVDNYGKPVVFGRYLETKEGVSSGLTKEEAAFLLEQGVKIIPIFNHFTNATGYDNGVAEAKEAIAYAEKLGIPEGKAIFADIEPNYPVDEAFIRGWVDTMLGSPYKPGIYGVFLHDSEVTAAYQKALSINELVGEAIIWSSDPDIGVSPQAEAPAFEPETPEQVTISIWQYGIDGQPCNIDTNLLPSTVLDVLW